MTTKDFFVFLDKIHIYYFKIYQDKYLHNQNPFFFFLLY